MQRDRQLQVVPDELQAAGAVNRVRKPPTSTFFHRSQTHETKSQAFDSDEQRRMIQSMYLAAIEPLFSPTAAFRRQSMYEYTWKKIYSYAAQPGASAPYWQRPEVSESLIKYWDSIVHRLGVTDSLARQRFYVLVPMCGSSKDLVWLYRQGVYVTGVDSSKEALETIKANNPDLLLQPKTAPDGTIFYCTGDLRLRIFLCNFFTCPSYLDHQYNFVWDRCAFSCINIELRKAYIRQLMHCRAENFHLLIETFEYDPVLFSLPPHPAFPMELQELLGRHLRTENVSRTVASVDWKAATATTKSVVCKIYQESFDRQNLPANTDPLTVTVQVTLLCNEP